jgi:hypothetical protein
MSDERNSVAWAEMANTEVAAVAIRVLSKFKRACMVVS